MKLPGFDSNCLHGKSHFKDDGTQNYLVFQPISRYLKTVANTSKVTAWESKGLFDESIKLPSTSNNSQNPEINYFGNARIQEFHGNCCKSESKICT